ncbi:MULTISPECIES: hypothetical protein [Protofrankia]|nr:MULTISPECIES: hypothetical protein [Protofrankia]
MTVVTIRLAVFGHVFQLPSEVADTYVTVYQRGGARRAVRSSRR